MKLKIIKTKKHPGAIFLKILGLHNNDPFEWLCKIYPRGNEKTTNYVAREIMKAFLDINIDEI